VKTRTLNKIFQLTNSVIFESSMVYDLEYYNHFLNHSD
jgi:hypothetical protein